MVAEEIRPGMANLPFDVGPGVGDGVVVNGTPRGRAGRESGLRIRDVITAIDGQPVRDLNDYARLIGDREPGERVRVSYRRGRTQAETTVELVRQPG
jgi:putative serine protease PepD